MVASLGWGSVEPLYYYSLILSSLGTLKGLFMKRILLSAFPIVLFGCSSYPVPAVNTASVQECRGSVELPKVLNSQFEPADDKALLEDSLGTQDMGKLCQGKVYISKRDSHVKIYRAWNSTNPNSRFGNWWSFNKPTGLISQYRKNYEICYQWSPLDKMISCTLKPGTEIVVGNGQSAECSEYLTYPTSGKQQLYIADATNAVTDCTEYDGTMNWK